MCAVLLCSPLPSPVLNTVNESKGNPSLIECEQLGHLLIWETNDNLIAETCYQFESRLTHYREKVILEILTHGTI